MGATSAQAQKWIRQTPPVRFRLRRHHLRHNSLDPCQQRHHHGRGTSNTPASRKRS
jgi:hypothetical protein